MNILIYVKLFHNAHIEKHCFSICRVLVGSRSALAPLFAAPPAYARSATPRSATAPLILAVSRSALAPPSAAPPAYARSATPRSATAPLITPRAPRAPLRSARGARSVGARSASLRAPPIIIRKGQKMFSKD